MQQNPSWEANSYSACQEIPRMFWNPKLHNRTHNHPPPVPVLSKVNPVHASHLTSWRSILILSTHTHTHTSGCSKWSLSLKFPHRNPACVSPLSHTILLLSYVLCVMYLWIRAKDGSSILQRKVCWVDTAMCVFYVHGTVHRNSMSINVQQDATIHSLFYL